jgi:hypothetical protein
LKDLCDWYGQGTDAFAELIGRSPQWLFLSYKDERLSYKNKVRIAKAVNIPIEFFDGLYELPSHKPTVNEPAGVYTNHKTLIDENQLLKEKLIKCQEEIIRLQAELLAHR